MPKWGQAALFIFGLAGVATLTGVWIITGREPSAALLGAFIGFTGLPAFLRKDTVEKW